MTDKWLHIAERVDAFRLIPRLIMAAYYVFVMWAFKWIVGWWMAFDWATLPNDQIVGAAAALAVAGFPAVILGVLTGVLSSLTTSYWAGGRDWTKHEPSTD